DKGAAGRILLGHRLSDRSGQSRFAHPARADQAYQPSAPQGSLRRHAILFAADEAGPADRQAGDSVLSGLSAVRGDGGQRPPIGDAKLAEQRRDVGLDRAHRDVEPVGNLRVRPVLAEFGEHLGLTRRNRAQGLLVHGSIMRAEAPLASAVSASRWWLSGGSVVATDVRLTRRGGGLSRP